MNPRLATFADHYAQALATFLARDDEADLHRAYELGREAIAAELGLIEVIGAYRGAFARLDVPCLNDTAVQRMIDTSIRFLTDSLAPFAMLHMRDHESGAALRRMNQLLEEEANRIAHALHDQAATMLAVVNLDLAEAARALPAGANEPIGRAFEHLDQLREQLRQLSHELRPPVLDRLGLMPALQALAEGTAQRNGLSVIVQGAIDRRLTQAVATTAYRVVQEALTNVVRHARADRAEVRVWLNKHELHGSVRDDGIGFDPDALQRQPHRNAGLGLIGVQERIRALRGQIELSSAPGHGTLLEFSLPQTID